MRKNRPDDKKLAFEVKVSAILLSIIASVSVIFIFITTHRNITLNCSYLDPLIVDILALLGSGFLMVEGIWSINTDCHAPLKKQIFRIMRILFGAAVFTMHILQISYG